MPTALIAGGGVAGLVSSIVFARRGWWVTVHEKSPELRAPENGFPMFENGLRILEALGLANEIDRYGHRLERWQIYRSNGELAAEYEPSTTTGGRIVMFHRQALVDLLAQTARTLGATIEAGSRIVGAEREGAILTDDGRRLEADLVIGADGIHSVVRRSIMGDLPLRQHRAGALRLVIPIEEDDFPDRNTRVGREYNDPSGRRIGLLPCSPNLMYMILVNRVTDQAAARQPMDIALWNSTFPMLRRYIERAKVGGYYDVYQSINPPAWHAGRCALIGDAAHGTTPALSLGANTAVMTAYALSATITGGEGLLEWERKLRPLVNFTQAYAEGITAGRIDPNNEIFFSDPNMRWLLEADIPAMFPELLPDLLTLPPQMTPLRS